MGRYIGPKNKIARRFGVNLGLKSNPAKVAKRLSQAPGVHGATKRRGSATSFGKQLIEKQKAKFIYGLRERQLGKYVKKANKMTGDAGLILNIFLETRLDNLIYRAGFANTRAQARQFVSHSMFKVGAKNMNIPSYNVKVGEVISLKEGKKKKKIFNELEERLSKATLPSWLAVDPSQKTVKVISLPKEDDFEKIFDVKPIIEFFSSR